MPEEPIRTWELGGEDARQVWRRGAGNHDFQLVDYRGLGTAHSAHPARGLAELIGAHWIEEENGRKDVLYPGLFRHSPATGKPLPAMAEGLAETWLPPFGNDHRQDCQGLRRSPHSLALRPGLKPDGDPDVSLPVPPPGEYQFLVGNFSARIPLLLAVNPAKGQLYLYLTHSKSWREITDTGTPLPESSLTPSQWAPAPQDGHLFLPTDVGLARLDINFLALDYRLSLVEPGCCLGAPALWRNSLFVPIQDGQGRLGILKLPADAAGERQWMPCDGGGECLNLPVADGSHILWLGKSGQLMLKKPGVDGQQLSRHIPWPPGDTPQFDFGSPYVGNNRGWQLCFNEESSRYCYVEIGAEWPERQEVPAPRFCSGTQMFSQAALLKNALPWNEPDTASLAAEQEVVIPLLEAAKQTVLCVRFPWTKGGKQLFAVENPAHSVIFELMGIDGDQPFFRWKMSRPWLTQAFLCHGHLYLYHPDKTSIPGWTLAP